MFCSNCGKQIPDGSTFCNYCGGKQVLNTTSTSPKTNTNQTAKVNKNSSGKTSSVTKIVIICLVFLVGAFIGKKFIAPSLVPDSGNTTVSGNSSLIETFTVVERTLPALEEPYMINPDYSNVLSDAGIVRVEPYYNMDNENFVKKFNTGEIVFSDYGYKSENDLIVHYTETTYYPISGLSETQKTDYINRLNTSIEKYKNYSCCTLTTEISNNYYIVKLEFKDLDKEENYTEYSKMTGAVVPLSMEKTEKTLLDLGSIKKRMD
ncbi:MAG: zinc-ribbon domain-containing protein [Clostridia bacterium]|nr:zinc-ribbon domain-containing protein [Clostridia bacterium]